MIDRTTQLSRLLGVNAQVQCDCGHQQFEIGVAAQPNGGNNFIRVLECTACKKQMPVVHRSDTDLTPTIAARALAERGKDERTATE